jgi:integrase
MSLTDTEVKKARGGPKPYKLSDAGGLFIWVTPSGGKIWRWSYRHDGTQKLMTLGKYPTVTLAQARARHAEGKQLLESGVDPMAQRKLAKTSDRILSENSFANISAQWLEHWRDGKSPRHVDSTRRRMEMNILPILGHLQISEIEAPSIVLMVKTIDARGARDIAARAMETAGQVFRYGIAHGHTKRNPVADIKPRDILKTSPVVNHARVDAKELPDLLRKIEIYQGTPVTRIAMKLMALTFVRTSELIGAKWSEFDFEDKRWNIPAERMKMRTLHVVPLATQAIELLRLLQELTGADELLFPGERDQRKPMSNNTILKALERMGFKGKMTGHGFRGVASTILHELEYSHDHIELQLAHAPRNSVSAAYNHALHLKPRMKMMQDWANYLEQAQRGAKVLHIRERVA